MALLRAAVLAILLISGLAYVFMHSPNIVQGGDFNAFYCAAQILPTGRDPYRYEPLHACESKNIAPLTPRFVVPAPIPPYALRIVSPLAHLPYRRAALIWSGLLVASAVAIVWAIVEITGLPILLVSVCVLSAILFQALNWGGLTPVPIAFLSVAAVAIVRSRWTIAAVLLGFACIEPHLALPAILASFCLIPAMRMRLIAVLMALAAFSAVSGGFALNHEYVTAVLPAQAISEFRYSGQYALSPILSAMGYSDRTALLLGSVQYALFAVLGVWLARAMRSIAPAGIIFAPMALAIVGGTYIHLVQVAGASLPLALVVAARSRWAMAWLGVALLAIPWHYAEGADAGLLAGLVIFVLVVHARKAGALAATIAGAVCVAAFWRLQMLEPSFRIREVAAIPSGTLAQVGWKLFADQVGPDLYSWLSHLPSYIGVSCTIATAVALAWQINRFPLLARLKESTG